LPKPNYSFEKRQRELAKKKKQDEKAARKREARDAERGPEALPEQANAVGTTQDSVRAPTQPEAPAPRVHLRKATGES
jgi:hypothetical protein